MNKIYRQLGVIALGSIIITTSSVSASSLLSDYTTSCNPTSTVVITTSTGLDSMIPLSTSTLYVLEHPINIITQTITTAGPCAGLMGSGVQATILSSGTQVDIMYQSAFDNSFLENIIIDGGSNPDGSLRQVGNRMEIGARLIGNGMIVNNVDIKNSVTRFSPARNQKKGFGLRLSRNNNSIIRDIHVEGTTYGINLDASSNNTISNISIVGATNGSAPEVGMIIQSSDNGVTPSQGNTISNINIQNMGGQGLQLDGRNKMTGAPAIYDNTISNIIISGIAGFPAISVCDGVNNTFSGFTLTSNNRGIGLGGPMTRLSNTFGAPSWVPNLCDDGGTVDGNTFINGTVTDNTVGIELLSGSGTNNINNNVFQDIRVMNNSQTQIINRGNNTRYLGEITVTSPNTLNPLSGDIVGQCLTAGDTSAIFNQTRVVGIPVQSRNTPLVLGLGVLGVTQTSIGLFVTGSTITPGVPVGTTINYPGSLSPSTLLAAAPSILRCGTKISSASGLQYSINGGARSTAPAQISSGSNVSVRFVAQTAGIQTGSLSLANNTFLFGVAVFALPPIVFNPVNDRELSTLTDSNTVTYTGTMPLTITGITNGSYSITGCDNLTYNTSGFVTNSGILGQNCQITIRTTSAATNNTAATATLHLSIGGFSRVSPFVVTTRAAVVSGGSSTAGGGGGGGGGGSNLIKDNCPSGDFSPSYYDNTCGTIPTTGTIFTGTSPLPNLLAAINNFEGVSRICTAKFPEYGSIFFTDIIGHRFEDSINTLLSYCAVKGRQPNIFEPNDTISVAEAVKISVNALLVSQLKDPIQDSDDGSFAIKRYSDLPAGVWSAPYFSKAYELGALRDLEQPTSIANAFTINPAKRISKNELVRLIQNISQAAGLPNTQVTFTDENTTARGRMSNAVTSIFGIKGNAAFLNKTSNNLVLLKAIANRMKPMSTEQQVIYIKTLRTIIGRASTRTLLRLKINKKPFIDLLDEIIAASNR